MGIFIWAVMFIVVASFVLWLFWKALEREAFFSGFSVAFVLALAGAITFVVKSESGHGPCFEYRTQLMYNAALKMMMPAKVCVSRGEWVDSDAGVE